MRPLYKTEFGQAFVEDSLKVMAGLPDSSVNLIMTSPPYALHFKKEYGNANQDEYIKWFLGFGREFKRLLTDDGSLVIDIGGKRPTNSLAVPL
jgi:DNA modification methylase